MRDDMARLQRFFCAFAGRMVRSGKRPRAFYSQCHERNLSTREWNVMKRRLAKYVFWEVPNNGPHCTVGSVIEVPPTFTLFLVGSPTERIQCTRERFTLEPCIPTSVACPVIALWQPV